MHASPSPQPGPQPTRRTRPASAVGALLASVAGRNRELVLELARREVLDRYAGTTLGSLWALLTPLLTMAIYVALFGFVFPTRFGGDGSPWLGAALILSGLVPWIAVADCASRAPGTLLAHRALVRQVVFPVEVLPAKAALASLVPQVVGTVVGLAIALATAGPSPMLALLPALWLVQGALMLGLMLLLSSLGVWLRDLREIVGFLCNVGLYVAPILLLPQVIDGLPRAAQLLVAANPFSHMVWCFHDAVVHQRFAHPWSWLVFPATAAVALALGARLFARLKPAMGEAL
jgi:lipopolysaccharide transport system permease protein